MAYQIEYAYTCHIGKVRNNNEDNFWCCGESLDSENKGMSHVHSGKIKQTDSPLLAVFDGRRKLRRNGSIPCGRSLRRVL